LQNKELILVNKIRRWVTRRGGKKKHAGIFKVRLGIGDDAAVLQAPGSDQELLITTDLLIENSHFLPSLHPARALGHKVLARGLSDIAAMGGQPLCALLSLCLPGWAGRGWQKQFFAGLFRLAEDSRVKLVGGDLASGDRFAADIVVLGACRRGRTMERAKAQIGDIIYVSGRLGGAALGWERLREGQAGPAVRRHLWPCPRLTLGRFLTEKLRVRAAMDLSDGLSLDLCRLTSESRVGAEIRVADVPVFPGATIEQALHGGEDYELLFTLKPNRKAPASVEGIPLTPIGVINASRRLILIGPAGQRRRLAIRGFQHKV